MNSLTKRMLAVAGLLALGLTFARAQSDGALLDALVKKGVLSDQEAEDIRADEAKEFATTPAGKLAVADYIKQITFYGDGRLRFDGLSQQNHYEANNINDRERYRLRFGVDYAYSNHLKAGFELESATADDTANQSFGATFTKASINVGKIYLQYAPVDWLTLTAGKFTNPWYTTTDLVYSNDLNPEGGAELFNFNPTDSLSVGLTAVQYLYVNSSESTSSIPKGFNNNDVQIIGEQVPVAWKITKDLTFKVAPGFTFYTGGGNVNYDGSVPANYAISGTPGVPPGGTQVVTYSGGTANSSSDPVFVSPKEADDLAILSAPGEFDFKVGDLPVRTYWDVEWNTEGKKRIQNVYLDPTASLPTAIGPKGAVVTAAQAASQNVALGDDLAWGAGVQVGQNKKKGDWSLLGEFRQIGLGAVDQNINGTDFADSYANQEGLKFSGVYNFTDFLTGTVTYYDTWDYKTGLYQAIGGGTGAAAAPTAGTTQYLVGEKSLQRIQVDIGWKF